MTTCKCSILTLTIKTEKEIRQIGNVLRITFRKSINPLHGMYPTKCLEMIEYIVNLTGCRMVTMWLEKPFHTCVITILQVTYEVMGVSFLGSLYHLLQGASMQAILYVVSHRSREKHRILGHQGHLRQGGMESGGLTTAPYHMETSNSLW